MKHVLTVLCLVGALAAYAGGWGAGVGALILLGLLLEAVFWVRVWQARNSSQHV